MSAVETAVPLVRAAPRSPTPRGWRQRCEDLASPGGLLLVGALGFAAIAVTSGVHDPDFWWHLRTGQLLIADHFRLLGTAPYTYTTPGHHWTMHEYLFEIGVAALYAIAKLGAVVVAISLLTWIGIIVLALRARMRTRNLLAIGTGIIVGTIAAYPIWGPRDQMIDFTFSTVLLLVIERYLTRGGHVLWFLLPFFLLWSNLHGGFVIGLVFLAAVTAAEALGPRLGLASPTPPRRVAWLALTTVGCALICTVNPNGPGILLYAWGTVASPAQQALIAEWQSPNFHIEDARGFAVMLIALVTFIVVNRRLRARDAVLIAGTVGLSFESVRNIAIFVAVATPVWVEQLSLLLDRIRSEAATRRAHQDPPARVAAAAATAPRSRTPPPRRPRSLPLRLGIVGAVAVLLGAAYAGLRLAPAMAPSPTALSYATTYPVCASVWLRSAPHGLRIFNQYGEGGYLSWSLAGTGDRIFIFGDAAFMGNRMLYTYSDIVDARPGWQSLLTKYGTQVVLFDTGTTLDRLLRASPRWALVYHDPHNDAFVLRSEEAALHLPPQPRATGTCARLVAQGAASGSA